MQSTSESGLACNVQANLALTSDSSELGKLVGQGLRFLFVCIGLKCAADGVAPIIKNCLDCWLESKKFDQQVQLRSAK